MSTADKTLQLKKHKRLATGLFLVMAAMYTVTTWMLHHAPQAWMGYVKAFSEAAMVGALADWFAVSALFHHPLGIPIPHTNLIEKRKKDIGDNLGSFLTHNFLTPQNIRPYMARIRISTHIAEWLLATKNKHLLLTELSKIMKDLLRKTDDAVMAVLIARKGSELLSNVKMHIMAADALQYFIGRRDHEELITTLAGRIRDYIGAHKLIVQERVKQESYFFIPKFIDNKLAEKVTNSLMRYFEEIRNDPQHHLRTEISKQLLQFAEELRTEPGWAAKFTEITSSLLSERHLEQYAKDLWLSLKRSLTEELSSLDTALMQYCSKSLNELATTLREDAAMQEKTDRWLRHTAYKYILRNTGKAGTLISNTVGNWKGRELSRKLELEVGKDLQFIRINGTLVGGLAGLVIYTVTRLLSQVA